LLKLIYYVFVLPLILFALYFLFDIVIAGSANKDFVEQCTLYSIKKPAGYRLNSKDLNLKRVCKDTVL